jgi:hypothetical protein
VLLCAENREEVRQRVTGAFLRLHAGCVDARTRMNTGLFNFSVMTKKYGTMGRYYPILA